ncbi:hypothetical protein L1049_011257 [Liquidambar formosana]|uniref:Uncharacterized protein n=1 Tax=Liquidambar formosana TaxID=63359 RepID=A0AAP0WWW7_LIQFO
MGLVLIKTHLVGHIHMVVGKVLGYPYLARVMPVEEEKGKGSNLVGATTPRRCRIFTVGGLLHGVTTIGKSRVSSRRRHKGFCTAAIQGLFIVAIRGFTSVAFLSNDT